MAMYGGKGLKIVHIVDHYYPELGYQIYYIASKMKDFGNDVIIVTSNRHSPVVFEEDAMKDVLGSRYLEASDKMIDGLRIIRLKTLFEFGSTVFLQDLKKTLEELKPDVIYIHGITTISAILCSLKSYIPKSTQLIYQTYQIESGSFGWHRIFYPFFKLLFTRRIIAKASLFIAIAEESKVFAINKIGIPTKRIKVLQHGADPIVFYMDETKREETRRKLYIHEDDIVFIYTGKILPYKCVYQLVESTLILLQEFNSLKLLIVGGGSKQYIDQIKKKVIDSSQEGNIIFHDAVNHRELPEYYCCADVAVWPCSVTIATLEAMASSLPVIVSDVPAAIERIQFSNGYGVSIQEDNLTMTMRKLIINEHLRKELGKNGRRIIEEKLNWNAITLAIINEIYQSKTHD